MNRREGDLAYRRLRAPGRHAEAHIEPSIESAIALLRDDQRGDSADMVVLDTTADQLSVQANYASIAAQATAQTTWTIHR